MTVYLEDGTGRDVRDLPDPADGTFDAAGNFDRLVDSHPDGLSVWQLIDRDFTIRFAPQDLAGLRADITRLMPEAKPGAEQRGLARLEVMAITARELGLALRFVGD